MQSQVTETKFMIEYDDASGNYNCNLVIVEGSATTIVQRIQFNTQFSILVPTGTNFNFVESINPIQNNANFMGIEPIEWEMNYSAIAPNEQPENDYYAFSPNIGGVTSHYNELFPGDIVTLFRVSADVACHLDIRPVDNVLDETSVNSKDYSNGITIGSSDQLYFGNELPNTFDSDIMIEDASFTNCNGECVTISPNYDCVSPDLFYSWSTGETTPTITVCPVVTQIYTVTVDGPLGFTTSANVTVDIGENVIVSDQDMLCVNETIYLQPEIGTWTSDDEAVIVVNSEGAATGIAPGIATLTNINDAGCTAEITLEVIPNPSVSINGDSEICALGGTTTLTPSSGGFWVSTDPTIATVDNFGIVTGIYPGIVDVIYTAGATGCSESVSITVLGIPMISNSGIEEMCIGEITQFTSDVEEGYWEISDPNIAEIDDDGIFITLSAGVVDITFTSFENDCVSEAISIIVQPNPPTSLSSNEICVGDISTITPSTGGTWVSLDEQIATITNAGVITGVGLGCTNFVYTNNASGCQSIYSETLCVIDCTTSSPCEGDTTQVLGTAFIDKNENGIYDSDEEPLRNVLVSIQPGDFSVLTDYYGNYIFTVAPGTYVLTANVNEGQWVQTELTIDDVEVSEPCNEGYNFGFVPISTPEETATLSMVNTITRCDFQTRFTITVENTGTETLNGSLVYTFDEETTYVSSEDPSAIVTGNNVTIMVNDLAPFTPEKYVVTVKMPGGSTSLPLLDFGVVLYNQVGIEIEEYSYSEQLRCSYDPNDKRVFPDREGDENLTLMEEDLEYTIRFQNNGNDTAFQVKIVDPLDPNIDPSSIRVVNSSHSVQTCIEGTDLIFLFENIFLVDSMTNYIESQGFVTFRCNPVDGIAEMTEIRNTADIIFDTNAPIITNQTLNTLVSELCTDIFVAQEVEICFGESYLGFTETGTHQQTYELPYGCDSTVIIVLEVQEISMGQLDIDVCEGESISIGGQDITPTENTEISDTTYNAAGCITSIAEIQINVVQRSFNETDFSVCEGEAITIDDMTYVVSESIEIIDTIIGPEGCISQINTININAIPVTNEQIDTTICEGFDYMGFTEAGTYTIDTLDEATGCLSTLIINLDVLPESDPLCTTSISDIAEDVVNIYPVPASEMIYYDSDLIWNTIQVINTNGQVIKSIDGKTTVKGAIDISEFSAGVYMMIFSNKKENLTKRFVVR